MSVFNFYRYKAVWLVRLKDGSGRSIGTIKMAKTGLYYLFEPTVIVLELKPSEILEIAEFMIRKGETLQNQALGKS